MSTLTPKQRSLRASLAALTLHSRTDSRVHTEPARAKSPGSDDYWLRQVDPDHTLPDAERLKRAQCAKRAHFQRLAFLSSKARRKGAA